MTVFQFKEPPRLDLTIIIVSFNTRDVLLDCLTSVYAQTEGISYEVIVVDNASSDDTPDFVAENFFDVVECVGRSEFMLPESMHTSIDILEKLNEAGHINFQNKFVMIVELLIATKVKHGHWKLKI